MCKKYRVYFSTPPNTKPGEDYLVDHSILCVPSPLTRLCEARQPTGRTASTS